MTGSTLLKWLLYWSNLTFPFVANFLVHSTIIIIIGLYVKRALRKNGAALQSFILRVCLIAVFVSPFASYLFHSAGLSGFGIQSEIIENMREVYSPIKDKQTVPIQSSGEFKRNPPGSPGAVEKNVPFAPLQKMNKILPNDSIRQDHDTARIPSQRIPETNIPHVVSLNVEKTHTDNYVSRQDGGNEPAHSLKWKILGVFYLLIPAVWAVFSLFHLTKIIIGILYIKYICRYAAHAAPDDYKRCRIIAREFGVAAPVILISSYVKSTLLTGLFTPTILLPAGKNKKSMASSEVFVHELAHLKRRDHVWNQLGQVGKIILPLQPLLGLLTRQIEELSDYVCDEYVIKHMGNRHSYASQLLHMVQTIKTHIPEFTPGIGIISTKSQLRK
ncbi:M56 family metallopeptidase, partial [Candidatus Latescibacterota bacterium]